jgi:hypothetical protein
MTFVEVKIVLALMMAGGVSAAMSAGSWLETSRGRAALASCPGGARRGESLRLRGARYGWEYVTVPPAPEAICAARAAGAPPPPEARRPRHSPPVEALAAAGAFAVMLGLAARHVRGLYVRTLEARGVDHPAPAPVAERRRRPTYREAAAPARVRRLCPSDARAFALRCASGPGAWLASALLFARAGDGVVPWPMPLTLAAWAASHLPAALVASREGWPATLCLGPDVMLLEALLVAWSGSPYALAARPLWCLVAVVPAALFFAPLAFAKAFSHRAP